MPVILKNVSAFHKNYEQISIALILRGKHKRGKANGEKNEGSR